MELSGGHAHALIQLSYVGRPSPDPDIVGIVANPVMLTVMGLVIWSPYIL
jgi:hypothetical protein